MIKLRSVALFLFFYFFLSNVIYANNVRIDNISLTNDSTLTFSISWDNSWRNVHAPGNHDAVWLFIKRKGCASLKWEHTDLSANMSDHTGSGLLEIFVDGKDQGPNAKGVFIRRKTHGSGNVVNQTVSIRLTGVANGEFDFKVFGIEMVQIPEGEFYLGDGSGDAYRFKAGSTNNPFLVTSEAITVNSSTGLYMVGSASQQSGYGPKALPIAFPKGYKEVYCMKYEVSQQQYVDFLNALMPDQAQARFFAINASRISIEGSWPEVTTLYPHRAIGNLSWQDLAAYLDWACLRPMTELEFEKICRGPVDAVVDEFAWGTNTITNATTIIDDGLPTESCSNTIATGTGLARSGNGAPAGPLRCGFAAKPTTDRMTSGASYYGVMEMSGNVNEMVVTTVNATTNVFNGNVGDGELSSSPTPGNADVATWPSVQTGVVGTGVRGGSYASPATALPLQVSHRNTVLTSTARTVFNGGRGVR